jgi:hypothetical protein
MADLIEAVKQGNGPGVTVVPHMLVAEFRGLCQSVSMLLPLRRVNAHIPVS